MGAPTFWNGVVRGFGEMFTSVIVGRVYYSILGAFKLLPGTIFGGWAVFLIYLMMVVGILELVEKFSKSNYWPDAYLVGYIVGVTGCAFVIYSIGLVPDIGLLLLVLVLIVSFAHRWEKRRIFWYL